MASSSSFGLLVALSAVLVLICALTPLGASQEVPSDVEVTNITADGTVVRYTTNDGNSSGVFSISAAQVKTTSGSPVAYVNVWVPSESFDAANPPQFLIQQNEIPVPITTNVNNTALNYFTKKVQGGSVTLMQLVVPLAPEQVTYVAVYFSYSLLPSNNNTGNNTGNNSTNPINGGGGNSTNSTTPINGGGNNSTGNSTNPINGGGNNNSTNNSTTPINGGGNSTNSTTPINGGGNNNSTNNSTTPINGGGSSNSTNGGNSTNTNNSTMLKVGVTGPVSFNLSAWITSDRGIPLPTTQQNTAVGGSLKAKQFQYFNFNFTMTKDQALYVALSSNSATAAGLQLFISVDKYATLDNFQFQSTFTKQYATNYVTYALLTDDQLPLKGRFSILAYSETSALDFTLTALTPGETEVSVGVNATWSIDKNSFSLAAFELPPAVVQGPSPLVLSFDTPSAASAFNTKIYLAHERLATQYDFDYTLSTADNVNGSASSSRYLIVPDSELKAGSWFVATYISNGAASSISLVVSLPGDGSIDISNTADSPLTTQIGANLWGVFHFNPQNTSSSERYIQFTVSSSNPSKSSIMSLLSDSSSSNFTIYGRYGNPPTPLSYDSISQLDKDNQVLCSDTNNFPKSQNGSLYYIAIVNQAGTTLEFSISVANEKECPAPTHSSKVAIVIFVIFIVLILGGAIAYYIMKARRPKPIQVGQTGSQDYRLLQHP